VYLEDREQLGLFSSKDISKTQGVNPVGRELVNPVAKTIGCYKTYNYWGKVG
jgi:hypothetical protein